MNNLSMWKLINGGWPGPWIVNEDFVRDFVKEKGLKPLSQESLQPRTLEVETKMSQAKAQINPIYILDPRGGMRNPHLHYRGKIYLLDSEQWNEFSGRIVKKFSEKLAAANSVTYDQLVELADIVNGIA